MRARDLFELHGSPAAPTVKPGTKPRTKPAPPGRPSAPRPSKFPDPFKTPWERPDTKEKPKACGSMRRTESVRARAIQVVDRLLEVKLYAAAPKPYPGARPDARQGQAASGRAVQPVPPVRGQGRSGWEICCQKCGRPTTSGKVCPACQPRTDGTTPSPVP